MSTTEQRLAANRSNGLKSTGPRTAEGKMAARYNATRHGLLSTRLLLEDEDPDEFAQLLCDLQQSLAPAGAIELALVERIAITLWRQRRLVSAEAASLRLARSPRQVARAISREPGWWSGEAVSVAEIEPYDAEQADWCRAVISEIEGLAEINLRSLEEKAPLVHKQLCSDAAEEETDVSALSSAHKGGLTGFVRELYEWCQEQLKVAERRPQLLELADQFRAKCLVLSDGTLEILSRYQTTLDNQLFKGLRALRDAQEWRLKTIEPSDYRDEALGSETA